MVLPNFPETMIYSVVWGKLEHRKIFVRDHFPHISQILEGIHFGANTCRACIRTRANTGNTPGELFSCIGFVPGCTVVHKHIEKISE